MQAKVQRTGITWCSLISFNLVMHAHSRLATDCIPFHSNEFPIMVQGGDVPFPKTTIERLPKPKEELWKQQMGLRDPKWSTTTRTTIGAFYKQGI